ncbi:50S ribosomal protein L25/general stress protein Ctc [Aliidiomarina halalkaliphila]|uniref:Large ribosomal subunit protein bL25 n=1 Tax=Aliidiomarina halalkaliphila TaxID=2593535 RepID=A0A552X321_9GAMM|nr:50S ribosomal protein L25/general stress protein Ctc [Aliidiomarina halalkaliphila]TRW49434.1 50S ribosomal protein L25/general stress protein Ctc [Aliidiomarina halalkaliphila]
MSQPVYEFKAEIRNDLGKGASRRLRREGHVPAILYGGSEDAVSLTLNHDKIINAADHEGFYSHILTLHIGGKKQQAILKDVQRHPFKPKITHLDFQRVSAKEELHTNLPIHFIGEDAVKKAGGVVVHQMNDIEIACLPKDLPEYIEIDVSALEIGDNIHLSQITAPKGVTFVELTRGEDHDPVLVTVSKPKAEKVEDDAPEAPEAPEVAGDDEDDKE